MAGHVFIVRGDLRQLACDAWLMPCSRRAAPESYWFLPDHQGPRTGTPFTDGGSRVQQLPGIGPGSPQPWLTRIGAVGKPVQWYVSGAEVFFDGAAETIAMSGKAPLFGRAKSLLALPVVGAGLGGGAERTGEIVQDLLPALQSRVAKQYHGGREFDAALVCWEPSTYAAAQAERVRRSNWPMDLTEPLRVEADALAQKALSGSLALFLGAGVSMAAGLPSWNGLLQRLACLADMSSDECRALSDLKNVLDQATIVERRLHNRGLKLGPVVKEVLASQRHYALSHALLAALPVREAITTNYDQLFDAAWKLTDPEGISVLPGTIRPDSRRWLLKMHGCLSDPEQIVLTRTSYTRYDERLPALTGIVQAFLVTRHVLFVGFSLTDDNFHRIVDAVRRLRGAAGRESRFGTTLTLGHGGLTEVLWEQDLHRIRMDDRIESGSFPFAEVARRLEIFLDYLLSRTRNTAHLLVGKRFDPLLTDGERRLRDALERFTTEISREDARSVQGTVAWPQIKQLLDSLGMNL